MRERIRRSVAQALQDCGLENLTLRWRFRLVVITFALPFLGYIVWAASQQAVLEKRHIGEETRAHATLLAARFDDQVEQIDRLLATAAQSIGNNISDVASINALVQSMRSFVPKSVDNIGVWALDGSSLASLDRRSLSRGVNVADRHYFIDAIAHREFAFEGPVQSRSTGVQVILFARPIFDTHNRIVGVLSMSIRPNELVSLLDQTGIVSDTALVMVAHRDGTIVSRSVDPNLWIGKSVANVEGIESMFEQRQGTREEVGLEGMRRLVGFAVVGHWPWVVQVGEPVEKVLGPTSDRLLRNLGVGLAIFALAFVMAGRVAAWTARPLMQLADDTERLRGGELSHRSAVVTGGEIALLAANFNSMASVLEERERALATSRQQLNAIADNVPAQVYYIDRDERYRFVNAHRSPLPGYTADEMLGRTVREIRGEALYAIIRPRIQRALAGESITVEAAHDVEGRTYHFLHAYVPDRDDDGDVVGIYCFAQDITERKEAELQRAESEKRLRTITDNLPVMISYIDANRRFRFCNKVYEKSFDRPLNQIIGQSFEQLLDPDGAARYNAYFVRVMQGETVDYEIEAPNAFGDIRWLKCSFIPDFDEKDGSVRGVYGMIHNVTKAKEAEQRLTRLAQFDTLTGIANRHQFNETLSRTLLENRDRDQPLALMFLDIDHFKQVNDRHGHACGDGLLKEFAQRLAESVRPTDAVARLSGDEFVVLLEGMHSDEEPQFIARKIIASIEKPFTVDHHVLRVTTSIGIAMQDDPDEAASTLMRRADEALYEAKRAGRNTFRLAVN